MTTTPKNIHNVVINNNSEFNTITIEQNTFSQERIVHINVRLKDTGKMLKLFSSEFFLMFN